MIYSDDDIFNICRIVDKSVRKDMRYSMRIAGYSCSDCQMYHITFEHDRAIRIFIMIVDGSIRHIVRYYPENRVYYEIKHSEYIEINKKLGGKK